MSDADIKTHYGAHLILSVRASPNKKLYLIKAQKDWFAGSFLLVQTEYGWLIWFMDMWSQQNGLVVNQGDGAHKEMAWLW